VALQRLYLTCRHCGASRYPLDARLGLSGFVSPQARRRLCLAGASWSFDRAAALLKEFCGLAVCDNTIRRVCHEHGGAGRDGQRTDPAAARAFRAAAGDVELETDGTAVNTAEGWREMRLTIFARRGRGRPGPEPPAPRARVLTAGIRDCDRLGPHGRRPAARLGVAAAADVTLLADGAKGIWAQADASLPGAAGVLDVYHASERLAQAGREVCGDTPAAAAWAARHRQTLLTAGGARLLADLAAEGPRCAAVRDYCRPHAGHLNDPERRAAGRTIGSGMVAGACKQVIGRRLKQTGARWRVRRADRMASLCGLLYSDLWDTYWQQHAA
jgi:hypothetical protein